MLISIQTYMVRRVLLLCVRMRVFLYVCYIRFKLQAGMNAELPNARCKVEQKLAMLAGLQRVSNNKQMHTCLPISMQTRMLIQN
jgi:hypothetical protein